MQTVCLMKKYLTISTSAELVRIAPESIVCITSDGNYSTICQADGGERTVTFQLGQIEALINSQLGSEGSVFVRIGRSIIVNRSFIYYINPQKQRLVLSDAKSITREVSASKEALKSLKELLEKEIENNETVG